MAYVVQSLRERAMSVAKDALLEFVNRELLPLLRAMRVEVNRMGGDARGITESENVLRTDRRLIVDATSDSVVMTLNPAADVDDQAFFFKKTDATANTVTVTAQSGETIDGASTYAISAQHGAVEVVSDGTNFVVAYRYP